MMAPLEGPVGIGALIDAVLLCCVFAQTGVYYMNSRSDTWMSKILVSLVLLFVLLHFGGLAAWLWASMQANTADASVPSYATILFGVSSAFGATVLFLERCFFAHRILKASNNHLLAFAFFTFFIFTFTAALGAASIFFVNATDSLTSQLGSSWIFPFTFVFGLVCDLAIGATTAFYLRPQTSTEVAGAPRSLARLFLLVAETSSVTSLVDVVAVLVYWLTRPNFAWVSLLVVMPGVFANALLAALNAGGRLCADIEHQRALKIGDELIDGRAKRPPIMITISKKMEKESEKYPV